MRVNAPRFGVIAFYCCHSDIAFAIIRHCGILAIAEAEPRSLFNFVRCHVMWFLSS
jgi:hypothetical protein